MTMHSSLLEALTHEGMEGSPYVHGGRRNVKVTGSFNSADAHGTGLPEVASIHNSITFDEPNSGLLQPSYQDSAVPNINVRKQPVNSYATAYDQTLQGQAYQISSPLKNPAKSGNRMAQIQHKINLTKEKVAVLKETLQRSKNGSASVTDRSAEDYGPQKRGRRTTDKKIKTREYSLLSSIDTSMDSSIANVKRPLQGRDTTPDLRPINEAIARTRDRQQSITLINERKGGKNGLTLKPIESNGLPDLHKTDQPHVHADGKPCDCREKMF